MAIKEGKPECFVVMPIRSPGTPEHEHFAAIYRQGIYSPIQTELGYHCVRADEVPDGSSINDDVIRRVASSEIVIADLTDLNPNVFYEIGIRHALRRSGTILVMDKTRTEHIPFDLSGYRTIFYQGNLIGIEELRNALRSAVMSLQGKSNDARDSPVHNVFPHLPINVVDASGSSSEGKLRAQLAEASQLITRLEKRAGITVPGSHVELQDPLERLNFILSQAEASKLPQQIYDQCLICARERRLEEFVKNAVRLCSAEEGHSPDMLIAIGSLATQLGLANLQIAIFDRAAEIFPDNINIIEIRISVTLTSNAAADRDRMRRELQGKWGITITPEGKYNIPSSLDDKQVFLLARYTESLRHELKFAENFEFVGKLREVLPKNPIVLRTYAAALRDIGRQQISAGYYKASIVNGSAAANADTAHWWAIDLENTAKFREAIQIQALGCQFHLDHPAYWANLVSVISKAQKYNLKELNDNIKRFGNNGLMNVAKCALSSSDVGIASIRILSTSLGLDESCLVKDFANTKLTFDERRTIIENCIDIFGTDYFESCAAAD